MTKSEAKPAISAVFASRNAAHARASVVRPSWMTCEICASKSVLPRMPRCGEPSHCPILNAPIPLRDLGPPLASIADPADVLMHTDEVRCRR